MFGLCPGKNGFVKFVKPTSNAFVLTCIIFALFELMLRRVTLTLTLADSLGNGLKREKKLRPTKIDMLFLVHHRKQYLDLHADLIRIDFSPQSEAALTYLKALLFLEISLLNGCD